MALALGSAVEAAPRNGRVVQGSGIIERAGAHTDIHQRSDFLATRWDSFNIAAHESVQAHQPDSTSRLLIRVDGGGGGATNIAGSYISNGITILENQNGVQFSRGAIVNVGGLLATSSRMSGVAGAHWQLNGGGGGGGAVVNHGQIVAGAGGAILAAVKVHNTGDITSKGGDVALGAGSSFTVDFAGSMVGFEVTKAASDASIVNTGKIESQGGIVSLSAHEAQAVRTNVVSVGGVVRATKMERRGGVVYLSGGDEGIAEASGDVQADEKIQMTGEYVVVKEDAVLTAPEILVGGDYQGKGDVPTARRVLVERGALLDAGTNGRVPKGRVIVWSDETTWFDGHITAPDGFAEVSGKKVLASVHLAGIDVGHLLLDPEILNIVASGDDVTGDIAADASSADGTTNISVGSINNFTGASLTLSASRSVRVRAAISHANLNLTLRTENSDGAVEQNIELGADIDVGTGTLSLESGVVTIPLVGGAAVIRTLTASGLSTSSISGLIPSSIHIRFTRAGVVGPAEGFAGGFARVAFGAEVMRVGYSYGARTSEETATDCSAQEINCTIGRINENVMAARTRLASANSITINIGTGDLDFTNAPAGDIVIDSGSVSIKAGGILIGGRGLTIIASVGNLTLNTSITGTGLDNAVSLSSVNGDLILGSQDRGVDFALEGRALTLNAGGEFIFASGAAPSAITAQAIELSGANLPQRTPSASVITLTPRPNGRVTGGGGGALPLWFANNLDQPTQTDCSDQPTDCTIRRGGRDLEISTESLTATSSITIDIEDGALTFSGTGAITISAREVELTASMINLDGRDLTITGGGGTLRLNLNADIIAANTLTFGEVNESFILTLDAARTLAGANISFISVDEITVNHTLRLHSASTLILTSNIYTDGAASDLTLGLGGAIDLRYAGEVELDSAGNLTIGGKITTDLDLSVTASGFLVLNADIVNTGDDIYLTGMRGIMLNGDRLVQNDSRNVFVESGIDDSSASGLNLAANDSLTIRATGVNSQILFRANVNLGTGALSLTSTKGIQRDAPHITFTGGDITLPSSFTNNGMTRSFTVMASGTLTLNGITYSAPDSITLSGTQGIMLGSQNIQLTSSAITITAPTLNSNGRNLTITGGGSALTLNLNANITNASTITLGEANHSLTLTLNAARTLAGAHISLLSSTDISVQQSLSLHSGTTLTLNVPLLETKGEGGHLTLGSSGTMSVMGTGSPIFRSVKGNLTINAALTGATLTGLFLIANTSELALNANITGGSFLLTLEANRITLSGSRSIEADGGIFIGGMIDESGERGNDSLTLTSGGAVTLRREINLGTGDLTITAGGGGGGGAALTLNLNANITNASTITIGEANHSLTLTLDAARTLAGAHISLLSNTDISVDQSLSLHSGTTLTLNVPLLETKGEGRHLTLGSSGTMSVMGTGSPIFRSVKGNLTINAALTGTGATLTGLFLIANTSDLVLNANITGGSFLLTLEANRITLSGSRLIEADGGIFIGGMIDESGERGNDSLTLTSGGAVTLRREINLGTGDLTITAVGGGGGGGAALTLNLNADIKNAGTITIGEADQRLILTLDAARTLTSTNIMLLSSMGMSVQQSLHLHASGTLTLDSHLSTTSGNDLTLGLPDTETETGMISLTNVVSYQFTAGGKLTINNALIAAPSVIINLAATDSDGVIELNADITGTSASILLEGTGGIVLNGDRTLEAAGNITLRGAINESGSGGSDSLTVNATTASARILLGSDINLGAGHLTLTGMGGITLESDIQLTGGDIELAGVIDESAAMADENGEGGNDGLTVTATGALTLNNNINIGTGALTLNGGTISLNGDSGMSRIIIEGGTTTLTGVLTSTDNILVVIDGAVVRLNSDIHTGAGNLHLGAFSSMIILGGDITLTGRVVTIAGAVDESAAQPDENGKGGGNSLTVMAGEFITLSQDINLGAGTLTLIAGPGHLAGSVQPGTEVTLTASTVSVEQNEAFTPIGLIIFMTNVLTLKIAAAQTVHEWMVKSDRDLKIIAGGDITIGGPFSPGIIDIGTGDLILDSATQIVLNEDATITGGAITLTGAIEGAGNSLTINAGGMLTLNNDINLGADDLSAGDLMLTAHALSVPGAIAITADPTVFEFTDLAIQMDSLPADTAQITFQGDTSPDYIFVQSQTDCIVAICVFDWDESKTPLSPDLDAQTSITINADKAATSAANDGRLMFSGTGAITIDAPVITINASLIDTQGRRMTITTSGGALTLNAALSSSGGLVDLTSTGGAIILGGDINAGMSDITLSGGTGIGLVGDIRLAGAAITLTGTIDESLSGNDALTATATGQLTLNSNINTGTGNLILTGASMSLEGDNTTITLRGGDIRLTGALTSTGPALIAQARDVLRLNNDINIGAEDILTLTGMGGITLGSALITLTALKVLLTGAIDESAAQPDASGKGGGDSFTINASDDINITKNIDLGTGTLTLIAGTTSINGEIRGGSPIPTLTARAVIFTQDVAFDEAARFTFMTSALTLRTTAAQTVHVWMTAADRNLSLTTERHIAIVRDVDVGTGDLTLATTTSIALGTDITLTGGAITLTGLVNGAIGDRALTITATGALTLNGNIYTGTGDLTLTGSSIELNEAGDLTTLTGGAVSLTGAIDESGAGGSNSLTVNASGDITLNGDINLGTGALALAAGMGLSSGSIMNGGGSGGGGGASRSLTAQSVSLTQDAAFASTGLFTFASTILLLDTGASQTVHAWMTQGDHALSLTSAATIRVEENVSTGGSDLTLTGDGITFSGGARTLSGANIALTGAATSMADLTILAMGTLALNSSITTTGSASDLSVTGGVGGIIVGAGVEFASGHDLTISGAISVAGTSGDLTLTAAGTAELGGDINLGTGTLTIGTGSNSGLIGSAVITAGTINIMFYDNNLASASDVAALGTTITFANSVEPTYTFGAVDCKNRHPCVIEDAGEIVVRSTLTDITSITITATGEDSKVRFGGTGVITLTAPEVLITANMIDLEDRALMIVDPGGAALTIGGSVAGAGTITIANNGELAFVGESIVAGGRIDIIAGMISTVDRAGGINTAAAHSLSITASEDLSLTVSAIDVGSASGGELTLGITGGTGSISAARAVDITANVVFLTHGSDNQNSLTFALLGSASNVGTLNVDVNSADQETAGWMFAADRTTAITNHSGALTVASAISHDSGAIALTAANSTSGGINVFENITSLAGGLTLNSGVRPIDFGGTGVRQIIAAGITLSAGSIMASSDLVLDAGTAPLVLNSGIAVGANDLTLDGSVIDLSSSITLTGANIWLRAPVSERVDPFTFTVDASFTLTLGNNIDLSTGSLVLSGAGIALPLAGNFTLRGFTIELTGAINADARGLTINALSHLTLNSDINLGARALAITAERLAVPNRIVLTASAITITFTGVGITSASAGFVGGQTSLDRVIFTPSPEYIFSELELGCNDSAVCQIGNGTAALNNVSSSLSASSSITIDAGSSLLTFAGTDAITITAPTVEITASMINIGGRNLTITSTGGALTLNGRIKDTSSRAVVLSATNTLTLGGNIDIRAGALTLSAGSIELARNITLTGASISLTGAIDESGAGGNDNFTVRLPAFSSGSLLISSDINLGTGSLVLLANARGLMLGAAITLTGGDISLTGQIDQSGLNRNFTANASNMLTLNDDIALGANSLVLSGASGILLIGNITLASQTMTITAPMIDSNGSNLILTGGDGGGGGGGGALTLNLNADITSAHNLTIGEAGQSLTLNLDAARTLESTNIMLLSSAPISVARALELNYAQALTLSSDLSTTGIGNDLTLGLGSGSAMVMSLGAGTRTLSSGGALVIGSAINSSDDLILMAAAALMLHAKITLMGVTSPSLTLTGSSITLNDVRLLQAAGSVELTGAIDEASSSNDDPLSNEGLTIIAGGDITLNSDINLGTGRLVLAAGSGSSVGDINNGGAARVLTAQSVSFKQDGAFAVLAPFTFVSVGALNLSTGSAQTVHDWMTDGARALSLTASGTIRVEDGVSTGAGDLTLRGINIVNGGAVRALTASTVSLTQVEAFGESTLFTFVSVGTLNLTTTSTQPNATQMVQAWMTQGSHSLSLTSAGAIMVGEDVSTGAGDLTLEGAAITFSGGARTLSGANISLIADTITHSGQSLTITATGAITTAARDDADDAAAVPAAAVPAAAVPLVMASFLKLTQAGAFGTTAPFVFVSVGTLDLNTDAAQTMRSWMMDGARALSLTSAATITIGEDIATGAGDLTLEGDAIIFSGGARTLSGANILLAADTITHIGQSLTITATSDIITANRDNTAAAMLTASAVSLTQAGEFGTRPPFVFASVGALELNTDAAQTMRSWMIAGDRVLSLSSAATIMVGEDVSIGAGDLILTGTQINFIGARTLSGAAIMLSGDVTAAAGLTITAAGVLTLNGGVDTGANALILRGGAIRVIGDETDANTGTRTLTGGNITLMSAHGVMAGGLDEAGNFLFGSGATNFTVTASGTLAIAAHIATLNILTLRAGTGAIGNGGALRSLTAATVSLAQVDAFRASRIFDFAGVGSLAFTTEAVQDVRNWMIDRNRNLSVTSALDVNVAAPIGAGVMSGDLAAGKLTLTSTSGFIRVRENITTGGSIILDGSTGIDFSGGARIIRGADLTLTGAATSDRDVNVIITGILTLNGGIDTGTNALILRGGVIRVIGDETDANTGTRTLTGGLVTLDAPVGGVMVGRFDSGGVFHTDGPAFEVEASGMVRIAADIMTGGDVMLTGGGVTPIMFADVRTLSAANIMLNSSAVGTADLTLTASGALTINNSITLTGAGRTLALRSRVGAIGNGGALRTLTAATVSLTQADEFAQTALFAFGADTAALMLTTEMAQDVHSWMIAPSRNLILTSDRHVNVSEAIGADVSGRDLGSGSLTLTSTASFIQIGGDIMTSGHIALRGAVRSNEIRFTDAGRVLSGTDIMLTGDILVSAGLAITATSLLMLNSGMVDTGTDDLTLTGAEINIFSAPTGSNSGARVFRGGDITFTAAGGIRVGYIDGNEVVFTDGPDLKVEAEGTLTIAADITTRDAIILQSGAGAIGNGGAVRTLSILTAGSEITLQQVDAFGAAPLFEFGSIPTTLSLDVTGSGVQRIHDWMAAAIIGDEGLTVIGLGDILVEADIDLGSGAITLMSRASFIRVSGDITTSGSITLSGAATLENPAIIFNRAARTISGGDILLAGNVELSSSDSGGGGGGGGGVNIAITASGALVINGSDINIGTSNLALTGRGGILLMRALTLTGGDIALTGDVSTAADTDLTITARGDLTVNSSITLTGASSALILRAGAGAGAGAIGNGGALRSLTAATVSLTQVDAFRASRIFNFVNVGSLAFTTEAEQEVRNWMIGPNRSLAVTSALDVNVAAPIGAGVLHRDLGAGALILTSRSGYVRVREDISTGGDMIFDSPRGVDLSGGARTLSGADMTFNGRTRSNGARLDITATGVLTLNQTVTTRNPVSLNFGALSLTGAEINVAGSSGVTRNLVGGDITLTSAGGIMLGGAAGESFSTDRDLAGLKVVSRGVLTIAADIVSGTNALTGGGIELTGDDGIIFMDERTLNAATLMLNSPAVGTSNLVIIAREFSLGTAQSTIDVGTNALTIEAGRDLPLSLTGSNRLRAGSLSLSFDNDVCPETVCVDLGL